jgi:hypothetical protein
MKRIFHRTAGVESIVPTTVDLFPSDPVVLLEKSQSFRNRHLIFPVESTYTAPESLLLPLTGMQRVCHSCECLSWGLSISGRSSKEAGYAE